MKSPRNLKPNEVVPYTHEEERRILAACDQIGGARYKRVDAIYERRRARAMILLLRHTALRISDVCTLRRDALCLDTEKSKWRVFVRTQKSGEPVFLPIPDTLKLALDAVPLPRNAAADCPYFFWNGNTARRAVAGIAERALAAVFKKSGVKNAHAHRHVRAGRGHFGEQPGRRPEALRQVAQGPSGQHRPAHDGPFSDVPVAVPVTRESHENLGGAN